MVVVETFSIQASITYDSETAAAAVSLFLVCRAIICSAVACCRYIAFNRPMQNESSPNRTQITRLRLQWRMLLPHAYLSRNGDSVRSNASEDSFSTAERLQSPLHISCLFHDLPPPPASKARAFGADLEEVAVRGV